MLFYANPIEVPSIVRDLDELRVGKEVLEDSPNCLHLNRGRPPFFASEDPCRGLISVESCCPINREKRDNKYLLFGTYPDASKLGRKTID